MKVFTSTLAILTSATLAFAQSAFIGSPAEFTSVPAGSNLTVTVNRPDTLTPSIEIDIAIGLQTCPGPQCPPPDYLGILLYHGPFDPEFVTDGDWMPHQNFSVLVPGTFPKGRAQLGVAHYSLVGASTGPLLEIRNVTLNIV